MKAIIIEDEELIADELQLKINEVSEDIEVIKVLPSIKTAKKWFFENAQPDLIFMDIQLSDGISFELFNIYKLTCPVIFTTAYDDYAIRAFKVNGTDYLLKPIDNDELKRAIDKCRTIIESKTEYPMDFQQLISRFSRQHADNPPYKEQFIVHYRHQWLPVKVKDIACFMKDNLHYIITFTGEKHILDYTSMEEIEELLDPKLFYRSNRQYIIHVDSILSVTPQENQKLVISLKPPLRIQIDMSREKAPAFKKWLDR